MSLLDNVQFVNKYDILEADKGFRKLIKENTDIKTLSSGIKEMIRFI